MFRFYYNSFLLPLSIVSLLLSVNFVLLLFYIASDNKINGFILVDTNIIIDHLRGKSAASEFLELNIKGGKKLLLSVIARVELMSGMRPDEEAKIESFLSIFEEVVINKDVTAIAGRYMNTC